MKKYFGNEPKTEKILIRQLPLWSQLWTNRNFGIGLGLELGWGLPIWVAIKLKEADQKNHDFYVKNMENSIKSQHDFLVIRGKLQDLHKDALNLMN